MKSWKYIIRLVILAFALTSCEKEDISSSEKESDIEKATTAIINFTRATDMDISISRSTPDGTKDVSVTDLFVYIFDKEKGALLTQNKAPIHITGDLLTNGITGKQEILQNDEGTYYNSSWVRIPLDKEAFGKNVHIYMIANAAKYTEIIEDIISKLRNISTETGLTDLICQYNTTISKSKLLQERTNFLMSGNGQLIGEVTPVEYKISEKGEISDIDFGDPPKITLERVESKINFTIKSNGSFTANSFKVHNYPIKTYAQWRYMLQDGNLGRIVKNDAANEIEDFIETEDTISITDNKFSFYMLENLKYRSNEFDKRTSALEGLIHRERYENNTWLNAPEHATYVEINGKINGHSKKLGKNIEANMTYTVHLGFAAYSADQAEFMLNDYTTRRNHEYNYKIIVNDVENIIAEITKEKNADEITFAQGDIILKDTITLHGAASSPFKLKANETIKLDQSSNNYTWFQLKIGTSITDWEQEMVATGEERTYNFRISDNTEGAHEATFKAIRTSEDGRRRIIREITVVTTGN